MSGHLHASDPHWDALLDESDADTAWQEWQAAADRAFDHAPYEPPFDEQRPSRSRAEAPSNDPRRSSL